MLRQTNIILLLSLLIIGLIGSGIANAEKTNNQQQFSIKATIVGQPIEVIPEDINFGVVTDLSTSQTAEPATFKIKGADVGYKIEVTDQVQITNQAGDNLSVILDAPQQGTIAGGEDSFQVKATLQAADKKAKNLEGRYKGTATVTVQYAD